MRVVLQRVKRASVEVDGYIIGKIENGILVFLGIKQNDTTEDLNYIVDKIANIRIFEDQAGKMNLSLQEINGEILIISQFTLYGDARGGRRPSYIEAARPEEAIPLYEKCILELKNKGIKVETGEFGADMQVELINDGPVTILLDSKKTF